MIDKATLWTVIIALGIGSFALRFAFLGILGNRPLPDWLLRHLRFTGVSIIPALVAPMLVWPHGLEQAAEPLRVVAGVLTLAIGLATRNALAAMAGGALAFWALTYWF